MLQKPSGSNCQDSWKKHQPAAVVWGRLFALRSLQPNSRIRLGSAPQVEHNETEWQTLCRVFGRGLKVGGV